jgi:hypothetical protein
LAINDIHDRDVGSKRQRRVYVRRSVGDRGDDFVAILLRSLRPRATNMVTARIGSPITVMISDVPTASPVTTRMNEARASGKLTIAYAVSAPTWRMKPRRGRRAAPAVDRANPTTVALALNRRPVA